MAPTNSFSHLSHSSLQQKKQVKHTNTGSTMLNIFFSLSPSSHMLPNIFPLHTLFLYPPFFAYPILIFFFFPFSTPLTCQTPLQYFPFLCKPACTIPFIHNCLGNENCTYLIRFLWQYEFDALQIISPAPLTPFMIHTLATSLFPVSHDLSSINDIGLPPIKLFLTFDTWFSLLAKM